MGNGTNIAFGKIPFDGIMDALEEAQRIRASEQGKDRVVKVEESPYGGYQVSVMPVELSIGAMGVFSSTLSRNRVFV